MKRNSLPFFIEENEVLRQFLFTFNANPKLFNNFVRREQYLLFLKFIFMNKTVKKILVNPFVISILVAILILIGLFFGSLRWLDGYTNHGKEIIVPDLKGLEEVEAEKILTDKNLQYEIIDSIFVRGRKPGSIAEQNPEAGANVKEERTIYLIINAFSPRKIILPDIRDLSLRQAEAMIKSVGLKIKDYEFVPSEYKNLVQDVKYDSVVILPGSRITEGASVTLLVGEGLSDEDIEIPSFRALSLEQAREKAHTASLNIGAALYDVTPQNETDRDSYFVYKQKPITNSKASKGQSVNLFLTKDKALLDIPEEMVVIDTLIVEEENLWE